MKFENLVFKDGLIPVVTQDREGQVLMLAYATQEALGKTIETKNAWYYSRSRKKLWMKGEESGNIQEIIGVFTDCDRDSILYIVKQKGVACHKGTYSCFSEKLYGDETKPIFEEVYRIIQQRKENRPQGSYVSRMIDDDERLIAKIREESKELIEAFEEDSNLVWEAADLIFHTFLLLVNKEREWSDIVKELRKRRE